MMNELPTGWRNWLEFFDELQDLEIKKDVLDEDAVSVEDEVGDPMTEFEIKLYTLYTIKKRESESFFLEAKYEDDPTKKQSMRNMGHFKFCQKNVINDVLWYVIRLRLDRWDGPLAIQKGYRVVDAPPDSIPPFGKGMTFQI